jgi:protein phosphatase/serine/threonine-protein phosphatase Stp1
MSSSENAQNAARAGSFRSCAATHEGSTGKHNEDAYLNRPDLGLWAVADGAGGHQAGEVASAEVIAQLQTIEPGLSAADMLQEVRARLEAAHGHLRDEAAKRGTGIIMATTTVVVLARDDYFACLWAGDSPAFLLRGGSLTKITRDHSLVQEMVDGGIISESEASHHPQANVITRAVGADSEGLNLDKRTGQLQAGDRLMLCSDGLSKTLSNERLAELLALGDGDSAERLVMAAVEARATDNVTAVTIDFDGTVSLQPGAGMPAGASADEHLGAVQEGEAAVRA